MTIRPRLLPIVMLGAAFLLGVKLVDLWQGAGHHVTDLAITSARAQEAGSEGTRTATGAGSEAVPPVAALSEGENEALEARFPPTGVGGDETTLRALLRQTIEALVEEELEAVLARRRATRDADNPFTESEVQVLQNLVERRELLDRRENELRLQENLLGATEKRINDRIAKLKAIEKQIQASLKQHDKQEEAKLKSLVKIYENMKPKDAARIFEQLDMLVLLEVAERMREAKIAPILAKMNPVKAMEITVDLANRRPLPDSEG